MLPKKSMIRYDSVKQRQNKLQIQFSSPLQLQYSSQPKSLASSFQVEIVNNDEQLIQNYVEMLNQETDIYYLFDCFHSLLNSLRQASEGVSNKKITQSSRQNTMDWWKLTGSSNGWAGMKNLQPLRESHLKHSSSRFNDSNISRGSAIIDNLKRQIGELTDQQKFKQNCRMIGSIAIPLFNSDDLILEATKYGRQLLTIYQLQNKYHKCHMGFCLLQNNQREGMKELLITKMYIAKWYRKSNNYDTLVKEFVKFIITQIQPKIIKIKINSSQAGLIKTLQLMGFKLSTQINILNDLKILSLILINTDFKS